MDAKVIYHGGGQSKIELCDVLTVDNTYIHIKPYSGSATLSHLFNQAIVSAELVMSDPEFREKANQKIKEMTSINRNTLHKGNCGAMRFSPDNIDKLLLYFQEYESERLDRAERAYDALHIIKGRESFGKQSRKYSLSLLFPMYIS